ncbi:helix-turn-helix domain-containing protein [Streptomyces sp. CB04723]|uniref:helix-turn-helix domain-containing protein n=1 Tax=Streptomyces TaxID=1883 RepID=UPI0015C47F25|nr:helix-turn-helix transcriptional regulator [Streptomyces sp. CB04723]QLG31344.1 helix-turn-helix domain-containing protein [Streptomyces sp. CB04723]
MPAVSRVLPEDQDATVTQLRPGSPDIANLMLGEFLRQCREERGLKQADLAYVIRASVSKVSRLERGESPPRPRDVDDLVEYMKLSRQERRTVERLLDQARDSRWYQKFSDVTPTYLRRLIALEGSAREIRTYENQVIPGVLQTREYAVSLARAVRRNEREAERVGELRQERQKYLREARLHRNLRLTALIDEGVLRRPRGGTRVMREQLEFLLQQFDAKRTNIRIVPFDCVGDVAPPYAVAQLDFPSEGPADIVYVEHINGADYITRAEMVDKYRNDLHQLMRVAADRTESKRLIRKAIERLES